MNSEQRLKLLNRLFECKKPDKEYTVLIIHHRCIPTILSILGPAETEEEAFEIVKQYNSFKENTSEENNTSAIVVKQIINKNSVS